MRKAQVTCFRPFMLLVKSFTPVSLTKLYLKSLPDILSFKFLGERVYEDEGDQATSAYGPVVEDEAEQYLNSSEADSLPDVPTNTKFLAQSKGHRRELIWKSPNTSSWSLEDVARRYEASLRQSHFQKVLNSRQGSTARIGHYCRGYRRTEIILTPHLDQSGIISHTSPVPHEICSVCGEEVSEKEVFDCRCGSLGKLSDNLFKILAVD